MPLLFQVSTHRLLSSSFLGLPYRILNMNHKKELLRSLWVFRIVRPSSLRRFLLDSFLDLVAALGPSQFRGLAGATPGKSVKSHVGPKYDILSVNRMPKSILNNM